MNEKWKEWKEWSDSQPQPRIVRRRLKRPQTLRFFTGADGFVYWVVISSNGKKLYGSTEGYSTAGKAIQAYRTCRDAQLSGSVDESALKGKRRAENTFAVNR